MNNLSISEQRNHAFSILKGRSTVDGYNSIDYLIDDECRKVLDLPRRPQNALPYVGWMMGKASISAGAMKLSAKGIKFIADFEGCRLTAYRCPGNILTIGYGRTKGVRDGQRITQSQAKQYFAEDLEEFESYVRAYVKVPLTQGQYDAMVSFCYNVGAEALRTSTLLKALNQGKYNSAALQFHRWVNGGGEKLPGLVRRRQAEYDMFITN